MRRLVKKELKKCRISAHFGRVGVVVGGKLVHEDPRPLFRLLLQLRGNSQHHLGVGILTLHGRLLLLPDRCMAAAFFHFVLLLMLIPLTKGLK